MNERTPQEREDPETQWTSLRDSMTKAVEVQPKKTRKQKPAMDDKRNIRKDGKAQEGKNHRSNKI